MKQGILDLDQTFGSLKGSDPDSLSADLMTTQVVVQADTFCNDAHGADFDSARMICGERQRSGQRAKYHNTLFLYIM